MFSNRFRSEERAKYNFVFENVHNFALPKKYRFLQVDRGIGIGRDMNELVHNYSHRRNVAIYASNVIDTV